VRFLVANERSNESDFGETSSKSLVRAFAHNTWSISACSRVKKQVDSLYHSSQQKASTPSACIFDFRGGLAEHFTYRYSERTISTMDLGGGRKRRREEPGSRITQAEKEFLTSELAACPSSYMSQDEYESLKGRFCAQWGAQRAHCVTLPKVRRAQKIYKEKKSKTPAADSLMVASDVLQPVTAKKKTITRGKFSKLQSLLSRTQISIVRKIKQAAVVAKKLAIKERLAPYDHVALGSTESPSEARKKIRRLGTESPSEAREEENTATREESTLEEIELELENATDSFIKLLEKKRALMPARDEPIAWGFISSQAYFADWRVNMEVANNGDDLLLRVAKAAYGSNNPLCKRQKKKSFHAV